MGSAFLLLMTLERAEKCKSHNYYSSFVLNYILYNWDKITKKRCNEQNNLEKIVLFKLFLVISPRENEKINK